ncbi:MAG: alpha/beta hydrolase [Planctomycetes bacterium]|nr:alpha/beta hydrolase [Planctomycetota bacterium]
MNVSEKPSWKSPPRRAWRIARPLIVAYLLIILGMMFLERWFVYPAPPRAAGDWKAAWLPHDDVWFQSADGTKLHGWFVPHENPKRAILYCHGNGEHVAFNADLAAQLRDDLQASVFLFDYRGYGHSEGRPSEAGCIADGRAAQHWLANRMGVKPGDVVLMGRSLGSAVAVALASEEGAQALVLENAFTNMPDVAAIHYPWLPVRWVMDNRYDSLSRIKQYSGPLIQSHGATDSIVPIALARLLFDGAPTANKKWIEFPDLDHNSNWPDSYYDELATFLDNVLPQISEDGKK